MTRTLLVAMVLCAGSACGSTAPVANGQPSLDTTRTEIGVILPESRSQRMCEGQFDPAPTAFWTPERAQIDALEAALPAFLEAAATEGSRLRSGGRALRRYRAQYVGIVRGDRELIFATFFCDAHGVDVEQALVHLDDGGDCSFSVEFDPATEEFSAFTIGGEG